MAVIEVSVYYAHFMKWLILFLIVWLVWRLTRKLRQPGPPPARPTASETMHACAHCGLNVPASEVLMADGHAYCSDAHRQLGPAVKPRQP
ncbi:MAG: hypothetical protein K2X64_03225 [Rhodocyclaceae bacterium]|nr:hypothetical protein [Rhodocyclaceae bacterium]